MDRPTPQTPASFTGSARVVSWNTGSGWTLWHVAGPSGRAPCGLTLPVAGTYPRTERALADTGLERVCSNCIREIIGAWILAVTPQVPAPKEG